MVAGCPPSTRVQPPRLGSIVTLRMVPPVIIACVQVDLDEGKCVIRWRTYTCDVTPLMPTNSEQFERVDECPGLDRYSARIEIKERHDIPRGCSIAQR